MNILFIHPDFPGQFKYLSIVLANNPQNNVTFITTEKKKEFKGIKKLVYEANRKIPKDVHPYLLTYENAVTHAQEVAKILFQLKKKNFKPDVIFGFPGWGSSIFVKNIFPNVPLISYGEWFYNPEGADVGFNGKMFNENEKAKLRCKNSHLLIDLYLSDAVISPTIWQKSQFPKEFHDKITVIHDGIDTESCSPNKDSKFLIKDKNLELTAEDEIITYATRGMEPYRGFPQFMEAVEKLQKKRPHAHFVIAGHDKVFYGQYLDKGTYKEYMLKKLKLDMSRIHFVGALSFIDYVKLLQISSAHIYLTYPFVLSWSILEAMSIGCCIIASNTAPVLEVMQDNYNGLLVDFYNVNQLVEKVEYALNNKDKMQEIRNNARQFILDRYDIRKLLPLRINFINNLIQNFSES